MFAENNGLVTRGSSPRPASPPTVIRQNDEDVWVFGYGSILWKNAEVQHTESRPVYVRGYKRRFWQATPDHRGTPGHPGRVASIYSSQEFEKLGVTQQDAEEVADKHEEWRVYGMAFRIAPQHREEVRTKVFAEET